MRRLLLAVLPVLLLAGCAGTATPAPTATPKTVTASGSMTVSGYGNIGWGADGASDGAPCQGTGGFSDMTPGAAVVVTDPKGRTVGTGSLEQGTDPAGSSQDFTCVMQFTVTDLPAGLAHYGFHVGDAARGTLEYTADQLSDVRMTLGA